MAESSYWFGKAFLSALNGEIDFNLGGVKVMLLTNEEAPSQDADQYVADLPDHEVANGNGYATGGVALGSPVAAYDADTNIFNLTGATVTWTSATFTARYAVIYDSTSGVAATNPLICYVDFGEDKGVTNGTLTVTIAAGGLAKVTVS